MHKTFLFLVFWFFIITNVLAVNLTLNSINEPKAESEHLVVFTDRDIYIAGEEALISLRLVHSGLNSYSNIAYLVLRNEHQDIVSHISAKLTKGKFRGSFYLSDTLSSGYYEIIAYTNYLKNFGEESYSSKQIFVVNRFDNSYSYSNSIEENCNSSFYDADSITKKKKYTDIEMSKRVFGTHEEVKFNLRSKSQNTIFNISVVPTYSFIPSNSQPYNFSFTDTNGGYCYPKEIDGIYLSGQVIDNDHGIPVQNARIFLSTQDTFVNLKYTSTDTLGRFYFHLSYPYQGRDVFIMADSSTFKGSVNILIDNRFNIVRPFSPSKFSFNDSVINYINKSQAVVRVNKSYKQDLYSKEFLDLDSSKTIPKVYSNPSFIYNLSDYVPLDDFREISREIIPYLKIRGRSSDYSFSMINGNTSFTFFEDSPGLFINGVPLSCTDRILEFGSNEIKRIEILNLPWHYGDIKYNGILSVYLNESVDINSLLVNNVIIYSLDSLANETLNKKVGDVNFLRNGVRPDFRQVLFWEPNENMKSNSINEYIFYTSHLKGDYTIVVEGYTDEGDFFIETKRFEVK